MVLVSRK